MPNTHSCGKTAAGLSSDLLPDFTWRVVVPNLACSPHLERILQGRGPFRYVGVVTWGRSEWKRTAADSAKRRRKLLAACSAYERTDERLRIISDQLWSQVKSRQAQRSHDAAGKVKAGLRRRRPGGGHQG